LDYRVFREADREAVRRFRCATALTWEKEAEQVIRRAPATIDDPNEEPVEIILATERDRLLGVAVFGPDGPDAVTIWAIGVIRPRQGQGIGTQLKVTALAEVTYRPDWPSRVQSVVHTENGPMLRINEKLRVQMGRDPDDPRYVLTAIITREQ
jgi:GNAT superfamily N-acetyltransferase